MWNFWNRFIKNPKNGGKNFKLLIELLSSYAEKRGSEASGLATAKGSDLGVFKRSLLFRKMRSMPANAIYGGVPAKLIGYRGYGDLNEKISL